MISNFRQLPNLAALICPLPPPTRQPPTPDFVERLTLRPNLSEMDPHPPSHKPTEPSTGDFRINALINLTGLMRLTDRNNYTQLGPLFYAICVQSTARFFPNLSHEKILVKQAEEVRVLSVYT